VYKLNSTDLNYRKNKIGQVHVLLQQLIFQRPINRKNVTKLKSYHLPPGTDVMITIIFCDF
jgi:hypothetical protein